MYYKKEIKFKEYPDSFSIETNDLRGKPDCKVGHFGYNRWFRTPKALKYERYESNEQMEKEILKTAEKNGLTFEKWVE